jgi:putative ABC transport system ATP-binding protein
LHRGNGPSADSVKRATAAFAAGRVHVIIGRPGSGARTLLAVIAGVEPADGGQICVGHAALSPLGGLQPDWRQVVGLALPGETLLRRLTARENVILALEIVEAVAQDRAAQADRLLARCGLAPEAAARHPLELSPLDRQLVSLARALAGDPPVILSSEPDANLGDQERARLVEQLRDLAHADGKCVVVTTRSAATAHLADEVWFMQGGLLLPAVL